MVFRKQNEERKRIAAQRFRGKLAKLRSIPRRKVPEVGIHPIHRRSCDGSCGIPGGTPRFLQFRTHLIEPEGGEILDGRGAEDFVKSKVECAPTRSGRDAQIRHAHFLAVVGVKKIRRHLRLPMACRSTPDSLAPRMLRTRKLDGSAMHGGNFSRIRSAAKLFTFRGPEGGLFRLLLCSPRRFRSSFPQGKCYWSNLPSDSAFLHKWDSHKLGILPY